MDFIVLIHPAEEGGYWTEVPALPGCFSQGETIEDAVENSQDAIECYLSGLREEGTSMPSEERLLIAQVTVAA